MFGGDVPQRVHVARHAAVVHGHDGPRLWCDSGFYRLGVDGVVARVAVDEDGNGVGLQHGGGGRHERDGGNDDLIPSLDAHGPQCRLQRHGAVRYGNAVFGILKGGKVALEPSNLGLILVLMPAPPPDAALQHALQQRLFFPAKDRPGLAQWFGDCG